MSDLVVGILVTVCGAALLALCGVIYRRVLRTDRALLWWRRSLWPPWNLLPVPVECVDSFLRFVSGATYIEMKNSDPPRAISLGLFLFLRRSGVGIRRTSWRRAIARTRIVDRFEVRLRCKDPTCGYEFACGHLGKVAVFGTLDEALLYTQALKKRDRVTLRQLVKAQPDEARAGQLSEQIITECPKCHRMFRYGPDDHYIQRRTAGSSKP